MKFKVTLSQKLDQNVPVTCVGWSNTEEVYSISDDSQILSWSVSNNQPTKIAQLDKDLYATDIQFLPRVGTTLGKHGDLILVTSADGKFHIINKTGRIERSVDAHKGAILVGQWGNDGTGLLTGGEDGFIKIWSRSGMLRSTVVSSDNSIYGACWSPDSQSIAYTQGKCVIVKQLAPNTKPLKWKAHEGVVLCLAWSAASDIIVSGGEDCKYRVWDGQGRPMFSSVHHDHHITSISWTPSGDLFAVGSYNTLRLCDYSGWSRSLEKPNTGSIYKMSWSNDGTQLAGACANGHVFFAHVIERHSHYLNYTASLSERKVVTVRNIMDDTVEYLELPERVIQMAMRYDHLVITTPSQCFIYSTSNWNTPFIFDLKDGAVNHLELTEKHFLVIEKKSIGIYNYQGKLTGQPRWPNMRLDYLRAVLFSFSNDTLAVRDVNDQKSIHIIDLSNNRYTNESSVLIQHSAPVIQIALDQQGPSSCRTLAVLDKSRDLYIVQVRTTSRSFSKLGRKIDSFKWNSNINILAAIQDAQLIVWYCPSAAFNSKLLHMCSLQYDSPELGRNPRINDFVGNSVSIRRADGSLISVPISPFPELIHKKIQDNKWSEALDLCRSVNNDMVWACLAVLATQSSSETMDIAEEAFASINNYEKVIYIQYIKTLPSKAEQKAHMALLGGKLEEAESILLHNGMVFQAIYININMHNWTRALDLATKHKTHVDTVLYLREKYLETLGKSENNNKYSSLKESVTIDPEKIKEKITAEENRIRH
ncbi:intraflagellar transport protein 80 homolog isoform X1 [Sitophilus oryzae]|uniref:Intraflagellar transport protein 80 homolog isoform X1 n=1 Tax=Sitophilus oryzae TaxID=7048 RepID=A0A6J2Y3U1_SITOR|nr:intraflagellar transport protein 80 homolog isoform X1 [Sitophilus oryzae]